ncbi:MAG: hypothetical protein GC154_19320 [bacterium]|nr:hypothetical protein [bacterium]
MIGTSGNGANVVYRFDASIRASIHINGTQIPPIDANGQITNFSLNSVQFQCESKLPIPAKGMLKFSLHGSEEPLEMPVDIVSRTEVNKRFLIWKRSSHFEFRLAIQAKGKDDMERYQRHMHRLIFGESHLQGVSNGSGQGSDDGWL